MNTYKNFLKSSKDKNIMEEIISSLSVNNIEFIHNNPYEIIIKNSNVKEIQKLLSDILADNFNNNLVSIISKNNSVFIRQLYENL